MKRLLIDKHGKRQLIDEGRDLHTHAGVIKESDLRKISYSGKVKTHTGRVFFVCRPTIPDLIEKMPKRAQVIYPKDASIITGLTGLSSGSKVVEAGVGVGGLSMMLANAVMPEGSVTAYEIREDHIAEAKKNLTEAGLANYVEIKNKDIYDGIDEKELDAVILDLPEPWKVVDHALGALKIGGFIVSYSPSVEQVKKFVVSLPKQFQDIRTIEVLVRDWEVSKERCRPSVRMIAHTGFITFARKLSDSA